MPKFAFSALALCASLLFVSAASAEPFPDAISHYNPGTGFAIDFATGQGLTNAAAALGEPARFTPGEFGGPITPFSPPYIADHVVSIGSGGTLTAFFSTPVRNLPSNPFDLDFIIYGNAGFIITNGDFSGGGITDGSLFGSENAATKVWVSEDNVRYFQLDPAQVPRLDALFPTDAAGSFSLPVNPALTNTDFAGMDLSGIRTLYNGAGGGAGFDIDWALDESGNPFRLDAVHFVRIDVLQGVIEIDGFAAIPEPSVLHLSSLAFALFLIRQTWRWSGGKRGARSPLVLGLFLLSCLPIPSPQTEAAIVREDFAQSPFHRGWNAFGDASLFRWDATSERLEVSWISSRQNSFFAYPLPFPLSKTDDFSISFDLRLTHATVGATPGQPFTFQIAAGFINLLDATHSEFLRGTGNHAKNLVEWNYFPDSGFGATISPVLVSSNGQFLPSFTFPLALTAGDLFHVMLYWDSKNGRLKTEMTRNGQTFGPVRDVIPKADFTDFIVDAVAVASYSDEGADGSIAASGFIDNLHFTLPDPIQSFSAAQTGPEWRFTFRGLPQWLYRVETTTDFLRWTRFSPDIPGADETQTWTGMPPLAEQRFFRLRADRFREPENPL